MIKTDRLEILTDRGLRAAAKYLAQKNTPKFSTNYLIPFVHYKILKVNYLKFKLEGHNELLKKSKERVKVIGQKIQMCSFVINQKAKEFFKYREDFERETGGQSGWFIDLTIMTAIHNNHLKSNVKENQHETCNS